MYKIGFIGDEDSVLGFKALGIEVLPTEDVSEAARTVKQWSKEDFAVIFLTEQLLARSPALLVTDKRKVFPVIVPIPGNRGTLGLGEKKIKAIIEKAVGVDLFADA